MNNTTAPPGELLVLMKPFHKNSFNYSLISYARLETVYRRDQDGMGILKDMYSNVGFLFWEEL